MSKWKIPFDSEGNFLDYEYRDTYEMRDNFEFEVKEVKFIGFERGKSSAVSIWELDGKQYPMFLVDFKALLLNNSVEIVSGKVLLRSAVFTFSKKGANYGVKLMFIK